MKDLLVIVPTRGRPGNMARQQAALAETRTSCDVLYAVDDDDPYVMDYARQADRDSVDLAIGPRLRLVGTLNFLSRVHAPAYRSIGFMGDDHLPRTRCWDLDVVRALSGDAPAVVYGNDLLQGANLATAAFMHSRTITALGYMAPPVLTHLYVDNAWMSLGLELGGLAYLGGTVIEHMHPAAGKAEWDDRYAEVNHHAVDTADRAAYEAWKTDLGHDGMSASVARVQKEYGL